MIKLRTTPLNQHGNLVVPRRPREESADDHALAIRASPHRARIGTRSMGGRNGGDIACVMNYLGAQTDVTAEALIA